MGYLLGNKEIDFNKIMDAILDDSIKRNLLVRKYKKEGDLIIEVWYSSYGDEVRKVYYNKDFKLHNEKGPALKIFDYDKKLIREEWYLNGELVPRGPEPSVVVADMETGEVVSSIHIYDGGKKISKYKLFDDIYERVEEKGKVKVFKNGDPVIV